MGFIEPHLPITIMKRKDYYSSYNCTEAVESSSNICELCGREFGGVIEDHHLIPKTFKGRETVKLHKICHRTIHSFITERELLNFYHTIERLLSHEKIANFVKWVKKKPPEFYDCTNESVERKRKRRR